METFGYKALSHSKCKQINLYHVNFSLVRVPCLIAIIETFIIEAISFSHIEQVDHLSGYMRRTFVFQLQYLETTISLCYRVSCKQVSSHMQDLLTSSALSQSRHQEVDIFFFQRANPALFRSLDILPLHTYHNDFV